MNAGFLLAVRNSIGAYGPSLRLGLAGLAVLATTGCDHGAEFSTSTVGATPGSLAGVVNQQSPIDSDAIPLSVSSVSVAPGAVWQINRPIDIVFDQPIDLQTVNSNTVRIVDNVGIQAAGNFFHPAASNGAMQTKVVRFQPNCPELADLSDAGMRIGATYQIHIVGAMDTPAGITVLSQNAGAVFRGVVINFSTPNSTAPAVAFFDTLPGPPAVRSRGLNGVTALAPDATYLEMGGDPSQKRYFQAGTLGAFEVPLNLYSDPQSQVAVVVQFDQPVSAFEGNLTSDKIGLEYLDSASSAWTPIQVLASVEQSCGSGGSMVRLEPLGLLPQGADFRTYVGVGFEDLTGDPVLQASNQFADGMMESLTDAMGGPEDGADELLESFVLGGNQAGSLEDVDTVLGEPRAAWGNGKLEASLDFAGTGGPGGNFDFYVPAGENLLINTTSATIVGGPNGAPVTTQVVVNGVVDVRDLYIPMGSRLIFVGPNPATILASGTVRIEGEIVCNGANSAGVGTLNTTFQPEPGASGNAGGGRGGVGSWMTTSSTPRGGQGFGAFSTPDAGGEGGESNYSLSTNRDFRRAAGGGGGILGSDMYYDHDNNPVTVARFCQTLIGMDSEPGFSGGANGTGAVSGTVRAQGGATGPSPFQDGNSANDFFGTLTLAGGGSVQGELSAMHAGAGGGAGGDASRTASFPQAPFQPGGDEKGSGGGGGAGGITILALGEIVIEDGGMVSANGGNGGGGENTIFFDRVGGGSGGGSGGHIILASSSFIEVGGVSDNAGDAYRDAPTGHRVRPLSALGGQGGSGHENRGGATEVGPTQWRCDGIDLDRVMGIAGAADVPPLANASICFSPTGMADWADPEGPVLGAGGDGGPGIIQLHVPDPAANLRFPGIAPGSNWVSGDLSKVSAPLPLGWYAEGLPRDMPEALVSSRSVGQSDWVPLGLARVSLGGAADDQVRFFFDGTDPSTGSVLRTGSLVQPLPDVIPGDTLNAVGTVPYVEASGLAIVLDQAALPAAYLANPSLMVGFSIVLTDSANTQAFDVLDASILPVNGFLRLQVAAGDNLFDNFINTATGAVSAALRPNFFRVSAQGTLDAYPAGTDVQIRFDAAMADANGEPDPVNSFGVLNGGATTDVNDLNAQNWDFFRFQVTFELGTNGVISLSTPRPALEFMRIPFVF